MIHRLTYAAFLPSGEKSEGSIELETVSFDGVRGLIQAIIGANEPIEHVSVLHEGRQRDMFVSEIGHVRLSSREPLPRNEAATEIYRAASMAMSPGQDPERLPWIAGPAVLFHQKVWS